MSSRVRLLLRATFRVFPRLRPASLAPALAICMFLTSTGCGGSGGASSTRSHTAPGGASPSTSATVARPQTRTVSARPPGPDPGTLPQTMQRPSTATPLFKAEMDALWQAIQTGSVTPGLPAFFPSGAYAQLKTLPDAVGDWRIRLLLDYRLDVGAVHGLLGAGAGGAQLIGVSVPETFVHWVPPGSCFNQVGYWEVPNSRLVWSEGGAVHSVGIASMISWRGVWYVVHLGATFRVGNIPVLDDPSSGPGVSRPHATC